MKAYTLEQGLGKSTNSILVGVFAVAATALLFSAMTLSQLDKVSPPKETTIAKLDVFLPPPPPPPPPEETVDTTVSKVPIQVDMALEPEPMKLTVKPVEATMDTPRGLADKIEINLTEFDGPRIAVDLESIVYDKSEVDEPPSRSYTPLPNLPTRIKKEMGDGRVIVQISIDTKGKPIHVLVLSSPVPEAAPHIIDTLKRWRFRPARKNGQKVSCWARFTLVFQAKTDSSPFSL